MTFLAVWADYLTQKLGVLIEKDITEACLAIDLPKALALILMERLESGGQRFLGWEVQGLVTIFLYTDPDEVHEDIADEIKLELFLAMQEVPGDAFNEKGDLLVKGIYDFKACLTFDIEGV